jgi:predicted metal-dependent hydrolase
MAQALPLEVRNLRFDIDSDVPRYWHGGRKAVSAFFDNLSVFFPPGERFFIASVKAHKDMIKDEVLKTEAKAFYAQEAIHSREHVKYNEMLAEHGYPVEEMEARVKALLDLVTAGTSQRMQLAVTAALEHYTALMAHLLLRDPKILEGADPVMAALWKWHAAEENEHKAVAFDVYQAAGGNYVERCAAMIGTTVTFWLKVIEQQVRMMNANGTVFSLAEWTALAKFLFVNPGGLLRLVPMYFDYFRPNFHPWDLDNQGLLDEWKQELETSEAYRQVA